MHILTDRPTRQPPSCLLTEYTGVFCCLRLSFANCQCPLLAFDYNFVVLFKLFSVSFFPHSGHITPLIVPFLCFVFLFSLKVLLHFLQIPKLLPAWIVVFGFMSLPFFSSFFFLCFFCFFRIRTPLLSRHLLRFPSSSLLSCISHTSSFRFSPFLWRSLFV